MAITIAANGQATVTLTAGQQMAVTGRGMAFFGPGPQNAQPSTIQAFATFGPYPDRSQSITLLADGGGLSYHVIKASTTALMAAPVVVDQSVGQLDPSTRNAVAGGALIALGTFALMGDSRNDQYSQANGLTLSATNYFDWFRGLSGINPKVIAKTAVSGTKTDDLERQVTQLLALPTLPQFGLLWSGINGKDTYTPAQCQAHMSAACQRLLNAGVTPIPFLDTGSTSIDTVAELTWLFELNQRYRELGEADHRIWVYDPTPVVWDPTASAWSSTPGVAFLSGYIRTDETPRTHTTPLGASAIGTDFNTWFGSRVPKMEQRPSTVGEMINANNPLALIANGMFTSTTGGGGPTAGSGSLTGTVPDNWNYNKGADVNTATTLTTANNANGFGKDVTLAVTTTTADQVQFYQNVATGVRNALAIGDILQAGMEVEVSGGTNLQGVYIYLQTNDGSTSVTVYDLYCGAVGATTGNGPQAFGPIPLKTDPLTLATLPSGFITFRCVAVFSGAGGATIKLRRAKANKRFST